MGGILTKVKPGEFHFKQSVFYVKDITTFITKCVASQTLKMNIAHRGKTVYFCFNSWRGSWLKMRVNFHVQTKLSRYTPTFTSVCLYACLPKIMDWKFAGFQRCCESSSGLQSWSNGTSIHTIFSIASRFAFQQQKKCNNLSLYFLNQITLFVVWQCCRS